MQQRKRDMLERKLRSWTKLLSVGQPQERELKPSQLKQPTAQLRRKSPECSQVLRPLGGLENKREATVLLKLENDRVRLSNKIS